MRKILSMLACSVMVLVGGIALTACGQSAGDKARDYVMRENVVSEFSGYKVTKTTNGETVETTVVVKGDNVDAVTTTDLYNGSTGQVYITEGVVYFQLAEEKYYLSESEFNLLIGNVSHIYNYQGDLSDEINGMIESQGMDVEVQFAQQGTTTTITIVGTSGSGENEWIQSTVLTYENDVLDRMSYASTSGGEVESQVNLESFDGEINFPDLTQYNPYTVDADYIAYIVSNSNCTWTQYDFSRNSNGRISGRVEKIDGQDAVDVENENGVHAWLLNGVLYMDDGAQQIKRNFADVSSDDELFRPVYNAVNGAIFDTTNEGGYDFGNYILNELNFLDSAESQEGIDITYDYSIEEDVTTYSITININTPSQVSVSTHSYAFAYGELVEYSAITDGVEEWYRSTVEGIIFPNFPTFVDV